VTAHLIYPSALIKDLGICVHARLPDLP
jgi:hypothetical protein